MTEEYLHFVWKHKRFEYRLLKTHDGQELEVLNFGFHNSNSGPDFLNAEVRIAGIRFSGHVEMHLCSSDWYRHGHQNDQAYNAVVLHVVYNCDKSVLRADGSHIPQLSLKDRMDEMPFWRFEQWQSQKQWIVCAPLVKFWPDQAGTLWIKRLAWNRFERRWGQIEERLRKGESWQQLAWEILCRGFGMQVNSDAFEALARLLNYKHVLYAADMGPIYLEALLFGSSGMLQQEPLVSHPHVQQLKQAYQLLKEMWHLESLPAHMWKFSRLRPANFPSLRMAQLAAFISKDRQFVLNLELIQSSDGELNMGPFWHWHYSLRKKSKTQVDPYPGEMFYKHLWLNVVLPIRFLSGRWSDDNKQSEDAIDTLESLSAEQNTIYKRFKELGFTAKTALETQGLLELYRHYCLPRKCLQCAMGKHLLLKPSN